jgi:hypothetical protein
MINSSNLPNKGGLIVPSVNAPRPLYTKDRRHHKKKITQLFQKVYKKDNNEEEKNVFILPENMLVVIILPQTDLLEEKEVMEEFLFCAIFPLSRIKKKFTKFLNKAFKII